MYYIKREHIVGIPNLDCLGDIGNAFMLGYSFMSNLEGDRIFLVNTLCSEKDLVITRINANIVEEDNSITEIRI